MERMGLFLWVGTGLYLVLIGGLYVLGAAHVRRGARASTQTAPPAPASSPKDRPRVRVIVPVTGAADDLRATLGSLLDQHHPNFEVVMVTRDEDDPATSVVGEICERRPHARHVLSGFTQNCAQKNHNLLKGLEVPGEEPDILVFCDANHWAPPFFLERLVEPVEEGTTPLASGYHRVRVEDLRMGSLGMLLSVMSIHLLHGIPFLTQPWGGATAVSAGVFESLNMRGLWADRVVDDYALGCRFLEEGIRSTPVSEACLLTRISGQTLGGWSDWLTRQLLFFKFFQPVVWGMAAPVAVVLTLPLLLSAAVIVGAAMGWQNTSISAAPLFAAVWSGLALLFRKLVPEPIPIQRWLPVFALMHFVTAWCYGRTWLTNRISWRGTTYEVGKGGRVVRIVH